MIAGAHPYDFLVSTCTILVRTCMILVHDP
jgi:hypothetical protein